MPTARPRRQPCLLPALDRQHRAAAIRDLPRRRELLRHPCALDRTRIALGARLGAKRFGSEGYAIEELVAELGAVFLCADLDLTLEPREDHAAYNANWLDVLKADNRAIFTAASYAAADFINGLQPSASGHYRPGHPGSPDPSAGSVVLTFCM
jgi:Zincin-like metallopeptidase